MLRAPRQVPPTLVSKPTTAFTWKYNIKVQFHRNWQLKEWPLHRNAHLYHYYRLHYLGTLQPEKNITEAEDLHRWLLFFHKKKLNWSRSHTQPGEFTPFDTALIKKPIRYTNWNFHQHSHYQFKHGISHTKASPSLQHAIPIKHTRINRLRRIGR